MQGSYAFLLRFAIVAVALALTRTLTGCQVVALVGSSCEMLLNNRGVDVRGKVVDQDGRPLDAVDVRIQRQRIARPTTNLFGSTPYQNRAESHTVGRTFRFSFAGDSDAFLSFQKPGYAPQAIRVASARRKVDRDPPSPAVARLLADPRLSNKKTLRVVLERVGQPAVLVPYKNVRLTCGRGPGRRGGTVADLACPPGYNLRGTAVQDLLDPSSLPADAAYILASTVGGGDAGPVDSVPIRTRGGSLWASPRRLRLIMRGEDVGLIRVDAVRDVAVLRGMKEAPATGYAPDLVLNEADMWAASRSGGYSVYFYFRSAGVSARAGWESPPPRPRAPRWMRISSSSRTGRETWRRSAIFETA